MSFPRYPAYKDSGVEWLGEVPEHWEVERVRRIFEIKKRIAGELGFDILSITQQGIKVRDPDSNDGQVSMDYSKYQIVEPGDFAMNHMDLLTGFVDISDRHGVTSPDYRVFSITRPGSSCPGYLLYIFQMGYRQKILYAFGQGSSQLGRWRLPTEQFQDWAIPFPSLEEQASIAAFLDRETAKIDALIAEQQRLIELLQEKRQAVISHAVTKGLDPDAPMKDSGVEWLGEVPEHWVVKKLKHLLSQPLSYGANEPADLSNPELPRYIRITDIQEDGTLNADTFRSLPAEKAEPYMLIDKDILLARSGATVGKAFLYKREFGPCCFAGYLILARLEARSSLPEWFRLFTESSAYWGQVKSDAIQATIQNVSAEKYGNILIPVPPKDELVGIVRETKSLVEYFERTVSAAMRSISLLHERRSALISAAVTGQIDVRGLVPEANAA